MAESRRRQPPRKKGDAPAAGRLTPEQIRKRYQRCDKIFDQWRGLIELCYQYAAPQRNLFDGQYEGKTEGGSKMSQVFDSTAISSLQRFANRIQSNVFPPQRKYSKLEPGTDIPVDKKSQVAKVLEAVNDRKHAIQRSSNFDIAMGEFLVDLGVGTAHMCIQAGDLVNPINYTCVSPYLVRFEEDEFGKPCNHYRRMRIRAELIGKLWPGAKLNEQLQTALRDKPEEEVDLIEATIKDKTSYKYHYHVITEKGDHEVFYREQKYTNWVTARFSKLAGETMGRGPVLSALPDIRTLNKVKELILKNAAIAVSGVWTGRDDGVMNPNNVKIIPGAVIGVSSNGGPQGPSLQALKTGADFNVAQLVVNDLVTSIKRILLDESLPPDTASARSATEIIERMKELAQNLGSAFGRLIDEVLIPVDEVSLNILDDAGIIEFPLRVNGREVKTVPVAPLAMAQFMDEVQAIINYGMIMQQLGQEGQVALNTTETIDYVGDKMGIPASIRNDKEERADKMQQMKEDAIAAAQVALAAQPKPPEKPAAKPMGMVPA